MTDRVEEIRGRVEEEGAERTVLWMYRTTLNRISVWLEAKGVPRSEEYVDALDRLFNEQQSEIQRLRKVEEAARELLTDLFPLDEHTDINGDVVKWADEIEALRSSLSNALEQSENDREEKR